MKTEIIKLDAASAERAIERAAGMIRNGRLVAFPTETVYGLGANALDENAVRSIYTVKGRPSDNPLIVHIAETENLGEAAVEVPDAAYRLMELFWPGPLTLVLKRNRRIPGAVCGGDENDSVAVRLPANEYARMLIRRSRLPIVAPSANLSGKPSPTSASHVYEDFNGLIGLILDGGDCRHGLESTVLSLLDKPVILRPGAVTLEMIQSVCPDASVDPSVLNGVTSGRPLSPGQKYKHYAPKAKVRVLSGKPADIALWLSRLNEEGSIALLSDETAELTTGINILRLGSANSMDETGSRLFAALRRCDEQGVRTVYAEAFEPSGVGLAVMNRLLRAAAYDVISIAP